MCLIHKWKVTAERTQMSPFEAIMEAKPSNVKNLDPEMFVKSVIVTYTCAKCGTQKVERV